MQGTIIKSTGSWYRALTSTSELIDCRLRGSFRLADSDRTNPIAVGDVVIISGEEGNYSIEEIADRKNYVIRKSNNLSKRSQIIASNIDLVLLIATIKSPRTSLGFIDRYLAICELYGIDVLLFFNKCDLYNAEDQTLLKEYTSIYNSLGYRVVHGSILDKKNVADLKDILRNKTVLLAGHSGVGKSSWLNKIVPDAGQRTANISSAHSKGVHTTTFAEMFLSEDDIRIIDTPGIKDFGIVESDKSEIQNGFREIKKLRHLCRFNDCNHVDEPECAILKALNDSNVRESRYYNYLAIRESLL
jgi:ribosome biogenesis GTPase